MPQRTLRRTGGAGLVAAAVTVLVLSGTGVPASAAVPMTLSVGAGQSGGGNTTIGTVVTAPGVPGPFAAGTKPTVQFQFSGTGAAASACSAKAKAVAPIAVSGTTTTAGSLTVDPSTVTWITTGKIAFTVPSSSYPATDGNGNPSTVNTTGLALVGGQTISRWNVCVYDSDSTSTSTLLASSLYTLALRPTITSILPASSSAGGGQSITVNGTGFSTLSGTVGVAIDGVALTSVRVAADGKSFTATTGPHAADTGLALTVDAPGGTVSSLNPDNDVNTIDPPIPFAYSNSITVTPSTGVKDAVMAVVVNGAGFSSPTMDFDKTGTPTSNKAHVFLVKDAYVAASNREKAECIVQTVVRDTELLCTLDLTGVADGAYVLTVVEDGSPGASLNGKPTLVTSGAVFSVAPY
jgi:hypothetical protein